MSDTVFWWGVWQWVPSSKEKTPPASSRGSSRAVISTLLGHQIDPLLGEAVKQVCKARSEGNITAGLQKNESTRGMEVAKHLDGGDPNPLSHLDIHPGGGCSLTETHQLYCRTDTMTGSRAVLAWCYGKAFLVCVVHALSRPPQLGPVCSATASLTQGLSSLANSSLYGKLWGKSQELILGDGTDYMIMA